MGAKPLKIDSLDLDLENPRITLATDQPDAMQKILNEQKVKLINLAESIAIRGFSPMDRCLVLRSHSFREIHCLRRKSARAMRKAPQESFANSFAHDARCIQEEAPEVCCKIRSEERRARRLLRGKRPSRRQ